MNRPYIFCHMMTSLDGKIMGNYMDTPESAAAGDVFYSISFGKSPYYQHQGWLSGRVTTDDNFTFYEKPELDEHAPAVPDGDFVAEKIGMYYVSVDPSGRLGRKDSTLHYEDTTAHVIEVLTGKASNAYKAFLRRLGISYIIAGEDALDYMLALTKLKELFGNVTFEPGCRNNWHIHHAKSGGGQILLCTAGGATIRSGASPPGSCAPARRRKTNGVSRCPARITAG